MEFKTLKLDIDGAIVWLRLNRPERANALDLTLWSELPQALHWIDQQPQLRAIVLAGEGKHFCAGADIGLLEHVIGLASQAGCAADARDAMRREILRLQEAFSALESARIPVIAAVHGACVGAGVDLIAACDLRYATSDAKFCIKEVDLGVVADVGTLQRLRHVIGLPTLAELAYTAETFSGTKAKQIGLAGETYETRNALYSAVGELAAKIAGKPALAVRGIKRNLLYARDHTVADALDYVATWNASALLTEDAARALEAARRARGGSTNA